MPTAATRRPRQETGSEAELDRLLINGREFSAEFPQFLANHLPMVIVALHRLGATGARLAEFFANYRDANRLVPMPPAVAPIERAHWTAALGDRNRARKKRRSDDDRSMGRFQPAGKSIGAQDFRPFPSWVGTHQRGKYPLRVNR